MSNYYLARQRGVISVIAIVDWITVFHRSVVEPEVFSELMRENLPTKPAVFYKSTDII